MKQINGDIDDANRNIQQLQGMMNSLKTSRDEHTFEAEEKQLFQKFSNFIFKSNALKHAAKKSKIY